MRAVPSVNLPSYLRSLLGLLIGLVWLSGCTSADVRPAPAAAPAAEALVVDEGQQRQPLSADAKRERVAALQRLRAQRQAALEAREQSAPPHELSEPRPRIAVPPAPAADSLRVPLASGGYAPALVVLPAGRLGQGEVTESGATPIAGTRRRQVSVPAFAFGRFEVTRGEFRRFVEAEGFVTDAERNAATGQDRPPSGCPKLYDDEGKNGVADAHWRSPGFEQEDSHPVVCVTWHDAQAYVAWLSRETGQRYRVLPRFCGHFQEGS